VLMLISGLAVLGGLISMLSAPSQQWYASAPQTLAIVQRKFTPVARLMSHIEELTNRAGKVASAGGPAARPIATVAQGGGPGAMFAALGDYVIGLIAVSAHRWPTHGGKDDCRFFRPSQSQSRTTLYRQGTG
jgi:hypothetical protein